VSERYRCTNVGNPRSVLSYACLVLTLGILPLFFEPFRVSQFTQILIIALAVTGLNLLTGFTGQISVGHAAFFGFGAYATAVLMANTDLAIPLSIAAGTAIGAAIGMLVGLPSLRIKGTALAIVTLVFGASFPSLVNLFPEVTGGTQGMRVRKISAPDWLPLASDQVRYYVALVVLLVIALLVSAISRSRTGRELKALGDNETAAVTYGVNAPLLRVAVFTISAAITALAGGLFVVTTGFISSTTSYVTILGSIVFLTALVIGGRTILLGPLLGSVLVELLPTQLGHHSPELAHLGYGLILIVILLIAPGGLTGLDMANMKSALKSIASRPVFFPLSSSTSPSIKKDPS